MDELVYNVLAESAEGLTVFHIIKVLEKNNTPIITRDLMPILDKFEQEGRVTIDRINEHTFFYKVV